MKIAFHFDADYEEFDGSYGYPINEAFFKVILSNNRLEVNSKLFLGDLLLHNLAMDWKKTKDGQTGRLNKDKYIRVFNSWLFPENHTWNFFPEENIEKCFMSNVYVLCLENIDMKTAHYLCESLLRLPYFLGALEVDDCSPVHWAVYSNSLIAAFRITNKNLYRFGMDCAKILKMKVT